MQNIDCQVFMDNAKKLAEKENAENAVRHKKEQNDKEVAALEKFKLIFTQLKFVKKVPDYGNVYDICGHFFTLGFYPKEHLSPYKPDWVDSNYDWAGYDRMAVTDEKTFGDYLIWAEKRESELKQEYEAKKNRENSTLEKPSFWRWLLP